MRKFFGVVLFVLAIALLYNAGAPQEVAPIERWLGQYVGDMSSVLVIGAAFLFLLISGLVLLSRPGR